MAVYTQVLVFFLIPFGGGIPAGVVYGAEKGLLWYQTSLIYLISDIILAIVFEPLMLAFIHFTKHKPLVIQIRKIFTERSLALRARYGLRPSPWAIILITFTVDPMTGRSIAKAAGHGFVKGWTLTIVGDFIYFLCIMLSTLWLKDIVGDGNTAMMIVLALMIFVPMLFRPKSQNQIQK